MRSKLRLHFVAAFLLLSFGACLGPLPINSSDARSNLLLVFLANSVSTSTSTSTSCIPVQLGGAMQGCTLNLGNVVTTIGGPAPGATTSGDADATGNSSRFNNPFGMTTDGINLYIGDYTNNKVRKMVIATGVVTTIGGPAPGATTFGDTDATGNASRFDLPHGTATDGTNLYMVEFNNNKLRKMVIATGVVTTIGGPAPGLATSGDTDATGNASRFNHPRSVTTDGTNLYIADYTNNKIRKMVIATGVVTTIGGPAPGATTSGDTDGIGTASRFNQPAGITTDGVNLYIADLGNNKIRKLVIATGAVTTIGGPAPGATTSGDTDGTGNASRFNVPVSITTDGTNLYIADYLNNKIRKIR